MNRRRLQWLGVALAIVVAMVAFTRFGGPEAVRVLLDRVATMGPAGPVLFALLHALSVVVLLPGAVFPLAAGFLFGVGTGSVVALAGKLIGGSVSFWLARTLMRHRAEEMLANPETRLARSLRRVDHHLADGGWFAVFLIRLVPVIPYKASNYIFGASRFSYRHFLLGTALGAAPWAVFDAWVGSLGRSVADLDPALLPSTPGQWIAWGIAAIVMAAAAVLLFRRLRQVLSTPVGDAWAARRGEDG